MAYKQYEDSDKNSPWFWMIAGPNGAGKSTWATSEESADTISHSIGGYSGLLRFARNDGNWRHCEEPKATKQPSFVCHLIDKWYEILGPIPVLNPDHFIYRKDR